MLKQDITFDSPVTGEQVTETHYFHLSKTVFAEMEIEEHKDVYQKDGEELTGMRAKLQRIMDSEDGKAILSEMKDIIRRSYGRKEGNDFLQTSELSERFLSTSACRQLIWDLCTDAEAMGNFINGIIPGNLAQVAAEVQAKADKIEAGRQAQATAKAAGAASAEAAAPAPEPAADTPEEATAPSPSATDNVPSREQVIEAATSENPVTLTEAEVRAIPHEQLRSGLADGRFKLA